MEHEVIQFVGVSDLQPEEQAIVNKLSTEYFEKLKRQVNNIASLKVHVKVADTDGTRKRYELHSHLQAPMKTWVSNSAQDWDLARTLHKSFQDLEHQVQHTLHSDDQRPKQ